MKPASIVAGYFVLQATATAAWWLMLVTFPASVKWFQPMNWPTDALYSYWLADLILIVGGSIAGAVAVWRRWAWASTAIWSVALVTWYPTLVCIATSVRTGEAWVASSMMVTMAGLSLAMATVFGQSDQPPKTIRVCDMRRTPAVLWTLGQIVIFWGVFLWVLPMGIMEMQHHGGVDRFAHTYQNLISIFAFVSASLLGLWSGITMATRGDGTPLPTATAPRFVIAGPYRYIRNPMAAAGILQGIAVGWYWGSVAVIAYSLIGALLWHIVVRPVEEADLRVRFGEAYDDYRKRVGLWLPTIRR